VVGFTINSFSPGTAINWELTENGPPITIIESGSGTDTISINKTGLASGNYTYTITGTKDGCTSSSLTIQVVVN